jgi:hypothetical protein
MSVTLNLATTFSDENIAQMKSMPVTILNRELDNLEEMLTTASLTGSGLAATFADMLGDDGVEYDSVDFRISSRYTVKGDVWLSNSDFRINISQHLRTIRAVVDSL